MKIPNVKIVQSMIPFIVLFSLFSCTKDTDFLVDYVVADLETHLVKNLVINDNFVVTGQKSIVLDVLANDTFTDPEKVKIIQITQPTHGTVIINDDKTLTYFPGPADGANTDAGNETEGSQSVSENNGEEIETNPPAPTDSEETPEEEETEPTEQQEEQKGTAMEDFTYTVGTSDGENNKTTQEATVTVTTESGNGSEGSGGDSDKDNSSSVTPYNYPSNAVFASSFGFQAGDATNAFKAAINSGSSYVVIDKQSSDWVIRSTRFFDLQNMTIVFEPGVTLRAKPGAFDDGDRLFELTRATNVTVEGSGATFQMNKNEYNSGEQRHAFGIGQCSDITVRGLTLRDSGGAGIYLTGDGKSGYSQNVTLENIRSLNNRRDGITIISAQDVWVRNSEFSQSSGTKPEAGVVLESDGPGERLVNINFINCKFSGNNSAGIHFSTNKMNSGSRPVSIKIVDCEFSNNAISPFTAVPATEIYLGGGHGNDVVGGEIRFERINFNGSPGRIVFTRKAANGFKAVFKDCQARNVVSSTSASPISLEANGDRNTLGGLVFDNFYIQYNRDVPFMHINAPSRNGSFDVKDVKGSFTIKEPNNNPLKYSGGYQSVKNMNVSINYYHI